MLKDHNTSLCIIHQRTGTLDCRPITRQHFMSHNRICHTIKQ
nr:MAG TPA: hypothetical protein [Caudoviricetes sp.]DAQ33520.1 MAG TPA: hypothetical protein [Caudoviricetes sp.]DAR79834.1 MAG TPA: hypothetical protein [Caudoviricetes sp.]